MAQIALDTVETLDPYAFLAVLGKRVIHPGGRRSTEALLERGQFRPGQRVLDVGCGVGTTAMRIGSRFDATVTAVDISPLMLERAGANVRKAGLSDRIGVEEGDILALSYPDNAFDRVIAEAVTMFVDRSHAARELVRVCVPGGLVLATEFYWRTPPTEEARQIFFGEVCPGMQFDSIDEWVRIYSNAGLRNVEVTTGPFDMMTPSGFLHDEGLLNALAVCGRTLTRWSYMRKMAWLMPRMARAVPYLGYILVSGVKPPDPA
ncbi:MAG: methyltransferase domain-containing protein [Nitrolancea sp.]